MLVDLRTRRVIGRFSVGIANDRAYWETVIFPMLLSVLGGSVGITELHLGLCRQRRGRTSAGRTVGLGEVDLVGGALSNRLRLPFGRPHVLFAKRRQSAGVGFADTTEVAP